MNKQKGFTLVELVVVIVILGIMSAVALPKFVNLAPDAHNAAAQGVAGAIASASSTNYAARTVNAASGQALLNTCVLMQPALSLLVSGVTLVTVAPASNTDFQISTGTFGVPTTCVGQTDGTAAHCNVLASGSGSAQQDAVVICKS